MARARITGTGAAVPPLVITNRDLESLVETSDEWIQTRSGIRERHIVTEDKATSDLAIQAARQALEDARVRPQDIDFIMVGTATPDMLVPATANFVQHALGAKGSAAMDLNAACSGFLFGVAMADALIQQGLHRRILVIGAEVLTRFVDWSDRGTCVLFGDGAGAVVVERSTNDRQGILSTYLGSDGGLASLLCIPGGGSRNPPSQAMIERNLPVIKMEGNEVFKHAVREMSEAAERALKLAGVRKEEVDLLIPHQANIRIIEATAKRLRVPMDRVYVNIDRFGNTSAASIPIALAEAARSGRLSPGAIVVMVAFGAGFSWAGVVMRW